MTRTIIQTAITNKALPLELDYRESSPGARSASWIEGLTGAGLMQVEDSTPLSPEFVCLLNAI